MYFTPIVVRNSGTPWRIDVLNTRLHKVGTPSRVTGYTSISEVLKKLQTDRGAQWSCVYTLSLVYYESRKWELKRRQNKLETSKEKDEVNKREVHKCDGRPHDPDSMVVPPTPKSWDSKPKPTDFSSLWINKRDLKIRYIYECRCDERLQTKTKEFTRLSYTELLLPLLFIINRESER